MATNGSIRPNPYTPGAGDRPRALVGRSDQLALAESVRSQLESGYSANSLIYVGLRGVGKTVLLKEIAARFARAGWYAPYLELRRGLAVDAALAGVADRFADQLRPGAKLTRSVREMLGRGGGLQLIGSGATIGAGRSRPTYEELAKLLARLASAASKDGLGVALIVDEMQAISLASLGALVQVTQELRDGLPFALIGAGLPHLPSYMAKAATYTERFRYESTDNLHDLDARAAILEPATAEEVDWEEDALTKVVAAGAGYPYFLQLYAFEAWNVAARSGRIQMITLSDVMAAEPVAKRQIEAGVYGVRFEATTEPERKYLVSMAALMDVETDRVRSGDVARALHREISAVSPTRDALIRKGVIHAPEHGLLAFSIPGFWQYVSRRHLAED
ncbi:ATP-binding protein [Ferrimicrobium sp.]|uniref:ATP-binding protein n=1 Tax=Ferrimicrobium sp. TaxID=2926050 RepID=UPI0026259DD4|nr:ATP-binding protein [Ferrimicrobium sp.]